MLEPTFTIRCPVCGEEMVFRKNSVGNLKPGSRIHVCVMFYKCPKCDLVLHFDVPLEEAYYRQIKSLIDGEYEPVEDWKMHEKIREKLRRLGYW